ncbi:hypothetical protein ABPG74_004119 [Tetrahymena malaccensis]
MTLIVNCKTIKKDFQLICGIQRITKNIKILCDQNQIFSVINCNHQSQVINSNLHQKDLISLIVFYLIAITQNFKCVYLPKKFISIQKRGELLLSAELPILADTKLLLIVEQVKMGNIIFQLIYYLFKNKFAIQYIYYKLKEQIVITTIYKMFNVEFYQYQVELFVNRNLYFSM